MKHMGGHFYFAFRSGNKYKEQVFVASCEKLLFFFRCNNKLNVDNFSCFMIDASFSLFVSTKCM